MRILDRYLRSIFVTAFVLVAVTFLALFTAMDLSSRIARILSLRNVNTLGFLAHYYLVRLPMFLHLVLPAVSLFAAMFTVIQLQKTNELLPMITSGVSLRRLSFIFILGALLCTGLMGALDEFVLPELMDDIGDSDDLLISDKPLKGQIYSTKDHVWIIDEVDRLRTSLKGVLVTKYRGRGLQEEEIKAEVAVWDSDKKHWVLKRGAIQEFTLEGAPKLRYPEGGRPIPLLIPIPDEGKILPSPPSPDGWKRRSSLSGRSYRYSELRMLVTQFPHVQPYWMHLHLKFASPLGPIILLFLGLPFVSGAQHRSFYRGIGLCLLLTIAYYAATFVCFELGVRGGMPPAIAVWGPVGTFGLAGLISFWRMRS